MQNFDQYISEIPVRFSEKSDFEGSWHVAQEITAEMGGTAINVAVTTPLCDDILWARSSMTQAWLSRYEAEKYHLIDPFIRALLDGEPEVMVDAGTLEMTESAYPLNRDLKLYGYGSLFATSGGGMQGKARSLIVYCSDMPLSEVDRAVGFDRLRLVHAILSINIMAPLDTSGENFLNLRRSNLTSKEQDILLWLASGLRNDQIAFKAGIAEVTVRKHLTTIRSKLHADTREQAVAIAMHHKLITFD